jgi:uncharacterized protein (TIGR03089 family)
MARTLPEIFQQAAGRDPGRPFLTFYDDASGERIELSYATTANWVAKTSNLLVDELDLETGETIAVALPPHWLGIVWALSAWSTHAVLTSGEADLVVTGPELKARGRRETVASALLPLGGRFREPLPDGVRDYGAEVYNHGDLFVPLDPPGPDSAAYDEHTHADLIANAEPDGRRVLSTDDLTAPERIGTLVALLAGGGSLVLCRNLDPDRLERRVADEKVEDTV